MGGGSTNRGYWRRRGYKRLGSATGESRSKRRRWSWRIKIPHRLKIKLRFNPKKWIRGIHEAYVRMMIRLANTRVVSGGAIAVYGGGGIYHFGMRPMKEYDERIIIQMYNSLVKKQEQLMAVEAKPPQITCSDQ